MGGAVFRILWMTAWVTVAAAVALNKIHTTLPGHEFFNTVIPKDERPYFLTFELSRGYTEKASGNELMKLAEENIVFPDALDIAEDLVQKFETLKVPDNFTKNLFTFVQTEFNLDKTGIRKLILSRKFCFENGQCIDLNDIGSLCCPF